MEHHAYIIKNGSVGEIWQFMEDKFKLIKRANPDILEMVNDTFGVEEARNLKEWSHKKAFGGMKVAVISSISYTTEAQNALLKLFEEPPENTYFFMATNNIGSILPTLLSRVQILELGGKEKDIQIGPVSDFLEMSLGKRLKLIAPIIKNKDKARATDLISGILYQAKKNNSWQNLEKVLKAEKIIKARSPYIKMVLEHLAITLPVK